MPLVPAVLQRHLRPVFVETGTDKGGGVAAALDAGAERVVSIEVAEGLAGTARERFAGDPRVTILHGDSAALLGVVLAAVREPVTVWLDAHQTLSAVVPRGQAPILRELRALASLPFREHVVMVDDMRCFRDDFPWRHFDPETGETVGVREIEAAVREINPAYHITYEDAHEPRDILVARV